MDLTTTPLLSIVILIAVNGMFSLAEIAVVSARKARLQQRAEEGVSRAQTAHELANAPGRFLYTGAAQGGEEPVRAQQRN